MKSRFSILVLMFTTTALWAAESLPNATIDGDWVPVKAELGGQAMDDAVLKTISMKLQDGKYHVSVAGNPDDGTLELHPSTTPKSLVIRGTEGPNKGRTIPAIYDLSPDTLRICYDLSRTNAQTPKEFVSKPGTRLYLVTYQRKSSR